ncbi:Serine/threonine-protein kinase pkn6 [Enhygromyxa salina]|uniref:Serine/threonine-protein kinase pkn6 n=1 Tax=Enhygromyxa salina TaxID=215803 RepID=A0A2S9XI37_9BACT|nr:serine/threonine-protein kinase [Enhygromyxa salina]PRP92341.1 Serine/threonine-protein kinase pkn6 [Enhygromyxa salina]
MQLGAYELIRKIGAGGMAEVWMARRVAAGGASKNFAVKRLAKHLSDKPGYREMFLSEARLSMLLSHSNIVQVFDADEDQGELFLAMEWIDGLDLAQLGDRLRATGERLSLIAASYVIAEVLTALAYAHDLRDEAGGQVTVVHRDISPQNVMLSVSGEVKLMDFGIARLQSEETSGSHIKGKVRYMPPEQLRGDTRAPTIDLFAVGAMLHELLDGQRFRADASDEARLYGMVLDGEVPELLHADEIPPELEVLRQRLLAEDVEDRIQSAREALECLYRWPGYRNAKLEIATLLKRLRGVEAPTTGGTAVKTDPGAGGAGEAKTELVAPNFDHAEPETSRTKLLASSDEGPELSSTRMLPGHGKPTLEQVDNPATERRVKGAAAEREDTELGEREGTTRTRREPAPRRGLGRVGASILGVLALAGVGAGVGAALGWFEPPAPPPGEDPSEQPAPAPVVDETRRARVLGDALSGYAGFRHKDMAALAQLGIEYAYSDEPDSHARLSALGQGDAEFALASLDRVLLERPAGKIVALVSLSVGADALILDTVHHPELQTLADLPKMLAHGDARPVMAYAGGTSSEYLSLHLDRTLAALDRSSLVISDDFADVAAVWKALEDPATPVALGVLWEPWVSEARHAGMTVAVSTRDFPHTLIDVLVASDRVLEQDPELVDALVLAYYRQAIALHREPRRLREQLGKETGLDAEDISQVIASLCILTPLGAEPWLVAPPPSAEGEAQRALIDNAIHHVWATLSLSGRAQGKLGAPGDYYDDRAVRAAAADTRELLAESGISALGIESTCLEADATPGSAAEAATLELGPLELPPSTLVAQPWFVANTPELALALDELLEDVEFSLAELNAQTIAVRVVGYGDGPGYKGRKLGEKRAKRVAELLEARGLEVQVTVEGRALGETAPTSRVEFELLRRARG